MITPSYSLTATERVLPRLALDFTTGVLDARVTVTRALNTATRVNSSGYIETVNANLPRFDYDPATLLPKGLLIEETRSNALLYSRSLSNVAWVKVQSSIVATTQIDPWGNAAAEKLTEDTDTAARYIRQDGAVTVLNDVISISVLAQSAGRNYIAILNPNASGGSKGRYFDITPGTNGAVLGILDGTPTASYIEKFGDWFLCTIVTTAGGASTSPRVYISPNGTSLSYAGDGSSGVYLSDPQLEVGSRPTSRIPTTSASVTRNADDVQMTGTNFSSWFNSGQGTFEVEYQTALTAFTLLNSQNSGDALLYSSIGDAKTFNGTSGASTANAGSTTVVNKAALSYTTNNRQIALNAGAVASNTGNLQTLTSIRFGQSFDFGGWFNGYVRKMNYWPQQVTTAELQAFSK